LTTTPSSRSARDNGAEEFTWPDGGQTPFAGGKGTVMEGGFPRAGDDPLAR